MPIYNKLVRDNIPEIIKNTGKEFSILTLSNEEFRNELNKKLVEELNEYINAKDQQEAVNELADIVEVIQAAAENLGYSIKELEEIRKRKAKKMVASKNVFF